ncbi:MAG: gamma-glutamyl-gamma-aminobutyrate hydrolase family protein [Acidobacteria bacterium]|nr:gamma-glutamyl-gamma-aminobutyrate hydrolase family protein [Acidobacteriota bacterium]
MAVIAVTSCAKLEDYKQAVLHAGGEVRIVEHGMDVTDALRDVGGLLMTGGDDVSPSRYGESKHPATVEVAPERDEFEIALVREARRLGLPIFAICRGIQVMNVACGGTLVQDIPTQAKTALDHSFKVPPHKPFDYAHDVWVDDNSLLARLMSERLNGSDSCAVNSRHHQAVKDIAPGFKVVATAPDGIIEAIEDQSARFCLGVQWHPENFWRTGEFRPLFEGFIEAAGAASEVRR